MIFGKLYVQGGIDPTYLALTPQASGPTGFTNPLWVDISGNLRSEKIYISQSTTGGATDPILKMENTNGNANSTQVELYKNSASPLLADGIGALSFNANNSTPAKIEYARIQADQRDTTPGSENGSISFYACQNSPTPVEYMRINGFTGTIDLYKDLNMGAVAIKDSASVTGTSGQYLTAGTGASTLWATLPTSVASITGGTNISITGTATVPIVNLQNPLTATLNLGTQNCQGTSSQITLINGGFQSNMQANLGFTSVSATPTTKANLFNTSISVETLADKVIIQPTSVIKSVGSGTFTIGTVGSAPLSLVGNGGNQDGISITQVALQPTTLTTNLSNVKYYPDTYINNNNSITVAVPTPQVIYQRLTLNNLGLTNTSVWSDYGSSLYAGYSAFFRDSNNRIWLAEAGTGNIQVCDNPPNSVLYNITMTGTSGTGTTAVNVFYEQGGYVFIGGNFSTINSNAQAQRGIARVALTSYTEDPMFNTATECGVSGGEVYDMTDVSSNLDIVGSFTQTNTGNPALRMLTITNPYVAGGGTQTFIESYGGADNTVYTILFEPTYRRVYYGGDFTNVGINLFGGSISANYIAYWDIALASWAIVAVNAFNGRVSKIIFTGHTDLYAVGSFINTVQNYNTYLNLNSTATIDSNLTLSSPPTYQQAFGSGGNLAVMNGTTFYREDNSTVWTSLGIPEATGSAITGINYDASSSGDWKVIYNDYGHIRSHSVQPQSCVFTGPFRYNGTDYGNYTIVQRDVSQQFIGDLNCQRWSIIGAGVGTFS